MRLIAIFTATVPFLAARAETEPSTASVLADNQKARARLYLKRRQPSPADIATFDRSGMWINASADGYVITALDQGGPAERAGLAKGNIITAIDGRPARMSELSDVRRQLRVLLPGSVVRLEIRDDGAPKTVSLTLRDLVSEANGLPARW